MSQVLKFELSQDEAGLVVAALAKQPFEAVAGLIGKIQQQAQPQLAPPPPAVAEKVD